MSRYSENECAFCAEETESGKRLIGKDFKIYCSGDCARDGENLSREEVFQLMQLITDRRTFDADSKRSQRVETMTLFDGRTR
jgi:hypothetical protein